jgi:hypothetical protein
LFEEYAIGSPVSQPHVHGTVSGHRIHIIHLKTYFASVLLNCKLEAMEANLLTTSLSADEVSVMFGHLESVSVPPLFGEE